MRIVSHRQVEELGLDAGAVLAALEDAFGAGASGDIVWKPKSTIGQPDGAFFIATLGCWKRKGLGLFHNIMGVPAASVPAGSPHYTSIQIVSDYGSGTPLACIDGTFTSTMLPVGVTALAAKRLANPASKVVAFVGAGAQARANLASLRRQFPLAQVRIVSRTQASASAFAAEVERSGLAVEITTHAEQALRHADIIVSTVPSGPQLRPFLDPDWVKEGAFVSAIDLGRSWLGGFERFDRLVTDDRAQAQVQYAEGRMPLALAYDTELGEIVTGRRPPRERPRDRVALIHPGNLVGVFAITKLIYDTIVATKGTSDARL
ncbi:MAG: NAD(P)-binding domain-containing protein [Burkholderiales bacterium]|nr:NAD(P)-binding domain-containing protein [Burkholderiales bacterium]